jgi:hypothetical protein
MGRVDLEAFDGRKLARVFIAMKMAEARLAEETLTGHGVDFVVLVEPVGRSLFGSERNGAVFCVPDEQSASCAELLIQAGLAIGVVPEGDGPVLHRNDE